MAMLLASFFYNITVQKEKEKDGNDEKLLFWTPNLAKHCL